MREQDEEQLQIEINHIFESGANEIRVFEMVKKFIEMRFPLYRDTEANGIVFCGKCGSKKHD